MLGSQFIWLSYYSVQPGFIGAGFAVHAVGLGEDVLI